MSSKKIKRLFALFYLQIINLLFTVCQRSVLYNKDAKQTDHQKAITVFVQISIS